MSPVGRTSRVFYAAAVLTHGVRCACSCSIAGQVHRNLTPCTFEQSKSLCIKFLAEPRGLMCWQVVYCLHRRKDKQVHREGW